MAANPTAIPAIPAIGRPLPDRALVAVFDLDGTLTRGDTLFPFLYYLAGTRQFLAKLLLCIPTLILLALKLRSPERAKERVLQIFVKGMTREALAAKGKAFAKEKLPAMLRSQAISRLAWHQSRGHRCVVLSASPALYVEPWAKAVGFDDVLATRLEFDELDRATGRLDGENCRGEAKVRRLEAHFGDLRKLNLHGYGDTSSDKAFLSRCAEAHYKPFRDPEPGSNRLADFVKLMRPHQWVKNAFVFVGLVFGHAWMVPEMVFAAITAAAGFSLASSAIYIVNDWADRERDRLHPKKRNRPLAAGRVTPAAALSLSLVLITAGLGLAFLASPAALGLVAFYAVMNLAYTFHLKSVVILDVFVIAAGFILRILAGTLAIGIAPSQWLLVCSLFLTLFLGFTKRRSELLSVTGDFITHRKTLLQYNAQLLDKYIGICAGGAIIAYSLYTMSPDTARLHGTPDLIYTIPFVIYGIFRYLYMLHAKQAGMDTSRDLARDPHLVLCVAGWGATTVALIA